MGALVAKLLTPTPGSDRLFLTCLKPIISQLDFQYAHLMDLISHHSLAVSYMNRDLSYMIRRIS